MSLCTALEGTIGNQMLMHGYASYLFNIFFSRQIKFLYIIITVG